MPFSKMGREGIKVPVQAITGEEWKAAWSQELSQAMDEQVRHGLRAGAKTEDGKQLRLGVDDQPEPQDVGVAAEPGAQFIEAADAGGADGRRNARAGCARALLHGTAR